MVFSRRVRVVGVGVVALFIASSSFWVLRPIPANASVQIHLSHPRTVSDSRLTSRSPLDRLAGFTLSMGLTRTQVESLFASIDGRQTVFRSVTKEKGVPRTLGKDKKLFTVVEISGAPHVVDVQVVTVLDTSSKSILENQVAYDSLTCRDFGTVAAQKFCLSRILNTSHSGLKNATKTAIFNGLNMTVRTYHAPHNSAAPLVSIDISAA